MDIGYARVSTRDQRPELQLDALETAGCVKVFTEKASGVQRDRPELAAALGYIREGDKCLAGNQVTLDTENVVDGGRENTSW